MMPDDDVVDPRTLNTVHIPGDIMRHIFALTSILHGEIRNDMTCVRA
jgi:hypothetical protein